MACTGCKCSHQSWWMKEHDIAISAPYTTQTYLMAVFVSPNSFLSVVCRNCITACCLDADGWEIGMSETCSKRWGKWEILRYLDAEMNQQRTTWSRPTRYADCR